MVDFVNNGIFCDPIFAGGLKKEHLFGVLKKRTKNVIFTSASQVISINKIKKYANLKNIPSDTGQKSTEIDDYDKNLDSNEGPEDFDDIQDQFIECQVSKIALNIKSGSKSSIDFLDLLAHTHNDKLYGQLQYYIDYKWNQDKSTIRFYAACSLFYLFNVVAMIIWL